MIVPAVVLPYHGQIVRNDRPLSWLDKAVRCAYCGADLTSAEQQKAPRVETDMQCDDCHAGEVAALLPFV